MSALAIVEAHPDAIVDSLHREGHAVVHSALAATDVQHARDELLGVLASTPTGRNGFEGFATRRVYALFKKTRAFDAPAIAPLVLGVLDRVLGHYQLSAPVGIQIGPGEQAQVLHRDDAIYPLPQPHATVVVNTMWPLDDFTEANGATRIVAGSHAWPADRVPDRSTETFAAEMPAGSVMFYLGNLWHGGGANRTDKPRLGVILEYVASWLRAQENHCLAVPRRVVRTLPPRLQELLGYNVFPPFVGYVDGKHPRKALDVDD